MNLRTLIDTLKAPESGCEGMTGDEVMELPVVFILTTASEVTDEVTVASVYVDHSGTQHKDSCVVVELI